MAPHSSTLAWKIPWTEEPGRLQSMGHYKSDMTERLHFHFSLFTHWRRKWQPTPVFLPGESQGQGSLVGCHLWGHTESDTTEVTQQQQQHSPELGCEATLNWESGEQDCCNWLRSFVIQAMGLDTQCSLVWLPQPSDATAVVFGGWCWWLQFSVLLSKSCISWASLPLEILIKSAGNLGSEPCFRFPYGICEFPG